MSESVVSTASASTTETTASLTELKRRVRRLLEDEPWEDTIDAAITSTTATTTTINSYTAWADQDIMEFDDDSDEQAKVQGTPGSSTVTIKRGHNDTTAATHLNGCVLLLNPRFAGFQITEAITRVVGGLNPQVVYDHATTSLTPSTSTSIYTLPADFFDIIDVKQLAVGTPATVYSYSGQHTILHNLPTGTWSSGVGIQFDGIDNTTNSILVTYRRKVTTSTVVDGMMSRAVVFGACADLLMAKDSPATDEDQRAGKVARPTQTLQTAREFERRYQQAKLACMNDLRARYRPARRYVR